MKAYSSFRKNTTSSEARPALAEFLELLKQHAEITPETIVVVHIYHHQDARVIRALAQRLPATTTRFQGGTGKKSMTAEDFLKYGRDWKLGGFCGILPNCPDVWGAVQMLDDALRIADVRFEMTLVDIQWKGCPEGWSNAMQVRGTSKKGRKYYLEFSMNHPSVASKDESLVAWKKVKAASGLNFPRNGSFFDDSLKHDPDPEIQRAIEACLAEAFFEAREELLARGLRWNSFAGVRVDEDAFWSRMEARFGGNSERIPFDRLIKDFIKREFPEFQSRGGGGGESETLWFAKPLTPSTHFRLHVEKIHAQGMGKTFELKMGVEFPGADFRMRVFTKDVFRLFRCGDARQWTYGTLDEFHVALGGLGSIIRESAPVLERAFRKWLSEMPRTFPIILANQSTSPGLTAREALARAEPIADQWRAGAILTRLAGSASAGRGTWWFDFADPADDRTYCRVLIPQSGRTDWEEHTRFGGQRTTPLVITTDSPEAWAAAARIGTQVFGSCTANYASLHKNEISVDPNVPFTWHFSVRVLDPSRSEYLILSANTLTRVERAREGSTER